MPGWRCAVYFAATVNVEERARRAINRENEKMRRRGAYAADDSKIHIAEKCTRFIGEDVAQKRFLSNLCI